VCRDGRLEERPSFGDVEVVGFPPPYGPQRVHLVPHPEPLTLSRSLGVRDAVFKVGYEEADERLLTALLALELDSAEPVQVGEAEVVPRDFAAVFVGGRGLGQRRTANVKRVEVDGVKGGEPVTLVYDFAVERTGVSASSAITGTVAAIAADLVARGGEPGVRPPEVSFDAAAFLAALSVRGFEVTLTRSRR
jgi:saccharopine dehydrogenase-like NADP-dependent oxidoreductase